VKERCEKLFQVFVVWREDRVGREWSEGDVNDYQVGRWGF